MKGFTTLGAVCALASTAAASAVAEKRGTITPVSTSGNAFFVGNERFYIRGVDYQPGGSSAMIDPIADSQGCLRDIQMFKKLGINTIRVYIVDNTKNHDTCMNALADAGIYLALDVNNPLYSLNRDDPQQSYNNVYLQSVFATIDAFSGYPNTLLFYSGNEVINAANNTNTAPYIKAVTRDMKNYIKAQSPRLIPVGYSAADVSQNRLQTAAYMNCGSDGMARADFFAFNDYSYCDSSYVVSGWKQRVASFSKYSLPLFLSEYGCNTVLPRTFTEVQALYNPEMTGVYSGGLVYEYSEEASTPNYGLVTIQGNTVKELPDFTTLQKQFAANPPPSGAGGWRQNSPISQCPPRTHLWEVSGEGLPSIPAPAEKYMTQGAGKGPGLKGKGSQTTGVESSGTVTVSRAGETETAGVAVDTHATSGNSTNDAGSLKQGWIACAMVVIASTMIGTAIF